MATLVLSSVKPFKIELVSPEFQSVFRFEEGLLLGRTLQILSGPCTQIERIIDLCEKEAAADCAVPRSARLFATLYDSDASARMVSMEVKRSDENRLFVSMEQSHAIHAKEALHDDGTCKLVMSALTQRIEKASSTFSNVYGLSGNVVAGRTISLIQGPGSNMQILKTWMDAALSGMEQHGTILTYTSECAELHTMVTVTPAHDGHGCISHIMVTLAQVKQEDQDQRAAYIGEIEEQLRELEGRIEHFAGDCVTQEDLDRQEVHNSKIMALLVRSNELLASSTQGKVGVYAQGGGSGDPSPQTPDPAPCGEEETRTRHEQVQLSFRSDVAQDKLPEGEAAGATMAAVYGNIGKCFLALGQHESAVRCKDKGQQLQKSAGM